MRNTQLLFFTVVSIFSEWSLQRAHALDLQEIEEKIQPANTILLSQKDFESGTYRIKSGGYYQLSESISFYPRKENEKLRSDKPGIGWFAAITIETQEGVIIDLNNYTLQADQKYIEEHLFNVFADIELDNCPFSGKLFGFPNPSHGFANFGGDKEYCAAENVIIKNGTLGRSGHWGIHGNNNQNIFIENIIIKDWQVRGIELNGLIKGRIRNVEISGLEHLITSSVPLVGALQILRILENLSKFGYYKASDQYLRLKKFIHSNRSYLSPTQEFPTGTIGGIFLAGAGVSNVGFPMTWQLLDQAAQVTGGGLVTDVEIENVFVHDITVRSEQFISIGSNQIGPDGNIIRLEGVGILPGFSLLWHYAYDANGNFEPNELLRAVMLVAMAAIQYNHALATTLPKNFSQIAQSILEKDHKLFLQNVKPVFTYPSHKIKGLFGIRIEGAQKVIVKNCNVANLKSVGGPCQELSKIFDAQPFFKTKHVANPDGEDPSYRGNDIWGYESAASDSCMFYDCIAKNIESYNGNPFGFELIADVRNTYLIRCMADSITGYSDILSSNLNLPSESYGFRVQRTDKQNYFIDCKAQNVSAPRRSFGFAAEDCVDAHFKNCIANNIYSISSKDTNDIQRQKVAFGFNSEMSTGAEFLECQATNIRIDNERNSDFQTQSIAAGIASTQNSQNSFIHECKIFDIYSGAGIAAGIYSDGENEIAHSNNTMSNIIVNTTYGYAQEMIIRH